MYLDLMELLKKNARVQGYNYWNPICGKVGKPRSFKFAMHNDQIYIF